MTLKNTINSFGVCLVVISFKVLLDYIYRIIISPIYSSTGFVNNNTLYYYVISWFFLLSLLPFIVGLCKRSSFTNSVLIVLTGLSLIPTTTIIGYIGVDTKFVVLSYIYWLGLFSYNLIFPKIKINANIKTNKIFVLICASLCIAVLYVSWKFTGFRFHWGITDVYDLRFEAREYDIGTILNYIMNAANTLLPVILVYFLLKSNKIMSIILILVILLNFGIAAHKSVLFSLILAIVGFYLFRYKRTVYAFVILLLINLLGVMEYVFMKSYLVTSLFTNRLLLVPSLLNYQYYDFFKNHEFDYFRQGFLRWFGVESPYTDNIAFMIGGIYSGDYEIRANNGLFSDAYFNAGFIGIVFFPLILICICKLIDSVSINMDERLMFVPVFTISLNFLSTTFTTALLTGGIILMVILFICIPKLTSTD